jgi:hypothetical protein
MGRIGGIRQMISGISFLDEKGGEDQLNIYLDKKAVVFDVNGIETVQLNKQDIKILIENLQTQLERLR